ncbi:hypothetical protein HHI36_013702 [Cryptolaemus montrouzieri]|uniref:BAT2 N-terminal domain-containing protein n=1 Tax=Cryptolaemus montrouzieri TaxID=559131 RepID=A0ABD2NI01_9CUCU
MSTLSGLGSKGEKQKSKFQSLDINKIYRGSRGESSEKTQQKSTIPYKHGMQSLGKVPNARRPPANLPSLKSEHSGSEAAVPLVPPGAPGWGKQDSNSTPNGLPTGKIDSHQTATPPSHQGIPPQIAIPKQELPHASSATTDKSWSSVMSRGDPHLHHPPPYQGPQFQHDFPSLSATEGGQVRGGGQDGPPYPSGLSLRPQTEGSWILGGSGSGGEGKPASGNLGAPPQLSAQAGLAQQQQQPLPPQYRGVMPSFMCKNNPPPANVLPTQTTNHPTPIENTRQEKPLYNNKKIYDDVAPPSIIKEEELHRMDEIERDMGWAYSDDIDYNKKLSFSDDELLGDKSAKPKQVNDHKHTERSSEISKRESNDVWQTNKGHSSEEEEIKIKRIQHSKEIELAVQKAKQRKKEEEKRFNEATKQGAKQKLKELEEKISKRDRDYEEGVGTINPSLVPAKPISPTEIPLPDFQKEKDGNFKERNDHSRMSTESHADKVEKPSNTFKQLTEIEGKTSFRRNVKTQERETRDQGVPTFSRQFQSNLPPRFKRHNQQSSQPQFTDHFDNRSQNYMKSNNLKKVPLSNDHDPIKGNLDDSPPVTHALDVSRKSESPYINDNYEFDSSKHVKEEKINEEKIDKREFEKKDYDRRDYNQMKNVSSETKPKTNRNQDSMYDRFQRLESQESKVSRESKYSPDVDSREYSSWSESKFDMAFEERRREAPREDRRQVPGPITRDRIEAEDIHESRNLTSLKRGQIPDKKIIESKNKEEKNNENLEVKNNEGSSDSKVWSDSSDKSKNVVKRDEKDNKGIENSKKNVKHEEYRDKDDKRGSSNRNKNYPQNKVWNNDYHHHRAGGDRGGWPKRSNSTNKNVRMNAGHKPDQFVATDSEGSSEEHHSKDDQKNTRSDRDRAIRNHSMTNEKRNSRIDKDRQNDKPQDSKRDNYVPRGEPSRHGRGGGNFRSRVGLSKRIDGYGPPPSKSPFTHHDKKSSEYDGDNHQHSSVVDGNKEANVEFTNDDKSGVPEEKNLDEKDIRNRTNKTGMSSKTTVGALNVNAARKSNQQGRSHDKKNFGAKIDSSHPLPTKQGKSDESNILCNAIADISLKSKEELGDELDEEGIVQSDCDGFQEVKSKKTVKERPKIEDKIAPAFPGKTENKDREKIKKPPSQLIQQPTHNIPPLMATLVNPPLVLPQTNKNQFDRQNRQNKMPPRFAKLRENSRLLKMHQQHNIVEMNDMKNRNMFGAKMSTPPGGNAGVPLSNAWDKPLSAQLRPMETENIIGTNLDGGNNIEHPPPQGDADGDKKINKTAALPDTAILDGTTPPVNTIIFENTNFKSVPSNRNIRNEKMRKEDSAPMENQSMSNFNKPINELLNKNEKPDSIQLQLPFKEDGGDMKLDFFDSDLTLTDEKSLKNPCLTRSMHSMTTGGNNISTADALNFKIQSVKKVWETASEHSVPQEDANSSFSSSFVPDPNSLDSSSFVKGNDNVEDTHEQHGYSQAANQQTSNNTTNVCKVKPTQQVSGASSQTVSSTSGAHPPHSGIMGPGLMGNPLSPPPIQPVIGASVGIGQPPQQYPTNQHIGYQTGLGSSSQYGMSTIPSPPTVLPYTAQPLQAQTANLYGPFQIDQTGVLGGQGRSQFSQYPNHYGLGQAASSPYSAQSMFLQTAQAHPPPAAQGPEMYQNLNNYRLSTGPFGQNQQLNNPTTVLISSTSNSLMSASVKPSSQQISAIGTKSGGVGQAYQQQSQQGQQMYMFDPNIQANYLQGAGVLQRPAGPVQNNVVPTIQPSSSYYSGSTGTAKPFCSWRF